MRPHGLWPHTLPVHPQRKPDEVLSSWIVRLAHHNHLKVHALCRRIYGNQAPVWNRDVDRLVPGWLVEALELMTRIPADEIRSYSLADLSQSVNGHHEANGNAAWVLPLGVWHRKRLAHGVQFCPLCLRLDVEPYVRRSWRLAYYTECEHHHVLLEDRCPRCGAAFDYFRGELGHSSVTRAARMSVCVHCGCDLAYAQVHRFEWPTWELTLAVRTLQFMNSFGWASVGDRVFMPAVELLGAIRQLITVMASPRRGGELFDAIAEQLWPEGYEVLADRGKLYERRSVLDRHRLFGMAVWLMLDWPGRADMLLEQTGLPRCELLRDLCGRPSRLLTQIAPHVR